jgi:DNA-binding CsgD family transcriptional regulator
MMRRGMEKDNPAFDLLVASLGAERHSQHYVVLRRPHMLSNSQAGIDLSTRQVIVLLRMAWRYHHLSRQLASDARGISDALGLIPQPFYILDTDLRLRHANAPGARLLGRGHGLKHCGEHLDLANKEQKQRLRQLVRAVADPSSAQQSRTMLLPQPTGYMPMVLNLFPLPPLIRTGLFGATVTDPLVAVLVRNAERGYSLCAERLKEYFGFTPAEARLAAALIDGSSVVEAARQLSISVNTARTHMKHIFEKTQTRRQTELAVLLVSTAALEASP